MASNASSVKMESLNPCCVLWKTRYSKMEEKRHALRKGVEILKGQIDRLEDENANLKKACDEERARLNVVEEAKGKETLLRISMEEEISALKLKLSSTNAEVGFENVDSDEEATHLRRCLSEREVEMDRLRQLLAEEIMRADAESKTAELERKNAAELQKSLEYEKNKADEAIKMADSASKKAEDYRVQAETYKDEVKRTTLQWEELNKKLEAEKQNAIEEKRCIDEKRVKEEECHANKILLKQLEEEKQKVEKLQQELEEKKQKVEKLEKEVHEIMLSKISAESTELDEVKRKFEAEKKKVSEEKRHVEAEKARVIELTRISDANKKSFSEEKCRADKLLMQLEEEKQKVAKLQREMQEALSSQKADSAELEELKRNLEEDKKAAQEQKRVEEERTSIVEQRRIAEAYKKSCFDEKCRADNLSMQLEEEKQKFENLQKEMHEVMQSQKTAYSSELDEVKRNLELEKKKVARERKRADLELSGKEEQKMLAEASFKNAMEEKCRADRLFEELESSRGMIRNLEGTLNKVNGMLEAERKEVAREKMRADMQKLKAEEQEKIAIENDKRAMEEKCRGDNLFQELENARQKLQGMEYELLEVKTSSMSPAFVVNEQAARVNLLQEQLKFEKERVKHFKEVAKLEKGRKSIIQQELQRLKHDFQCLLDHLSMLSDIFGARNGGTYLPKISGRSQMHFRGDDELRMSCLSSKDPSCLLKSNMRLVQAGHCMESTGMENDLDPLEGGSRGDNLPGSALNSNTASFSDEQLVGSQERFAGSLAMSAGLSVDNTNQRINNQATFLGCSNECHKLKNGKKVGIVGEQSIRSPLETSSGRAKKRRKLLDEIESIKNLHFEGKRIFQDAEKKLFALHDTLLQPKMNEQMEKEILSLPASKSNLCGNLERSSKKRKKLLEPEAVLQQAGESNLQMEVAPSVMERREGSEPLQILGRDQVTHNQDAMMSFEEVMNGDYMKLLDLDDAVSEECFRMAMERPLSPTLPDFDFLKFGQKVGGQTLCVPTRYSDAVPQHGFSAQIKSQLHVVLFSDMEDIGSITRIFCATRTCVDHCLFLQTNWSMQDIQGVLLLEKDLTPREKACVLFSLMLLNFSAKSSNKSTNFHIQEQMDSLSAHIHAVLFNSDTRELCAKICDLRDVLTLSEDFVIHRKLLSNIDVSCKLLDDCGSGIEILDQGEKIVLWPNMAPSDLVVAGSCVLASLCKAVGHIGSLCEVSVKILQMGGAEYSLALSILHTFASICGKEYFTISNYSLIMKVVKSVVTFMEGSLTKNVIKDPQPGDITQHQFSICDRCPFSEGSVTLDNVSSELLEELQRHMVSQIPAHSSNSEILSCFLGDVLSSLELIASIMCWDWVCDKIVPKLFQMLESSYQDKVLSTALVALLGYIGRLGVEARGYNDTGVEGIKRRLLGLLCQTTASNCDSALPMAVVYGLIGLCPKGHEMFQKGCNVELPSEGHPASASSESDNIVRKFLSSLSSGQITSLASLVNTDIGVAA